MTITTIKVSRYAWSVTANQDGIIATYQSRNRRTAFRKAIAACRKKYMEQEHGTN